MGGAAGASSARSVRRSDASRSAGPPPSTGSGSPSRTPSIPGRSAREQEASPQIAVSKAASRMVDRAFTGTRGFEMAEVQPLPALITATTLLIRSRIEVLTSKAADSWPLAPTPPAQGLQGPRFSHGTQLRGDSLAPESGVDRTGQRAGLGLSRMPAAGRLPR